jgi:two-component system NarL family sensor kinase
MFQTSLIFNVITLISCITTLTIIFYGIMIFHSIKEYNSKSLSLQSNIEELKLNQEKMILETEIEIQEQTFQFISREIHDNIIQSLSLAKLNLNILDINNPKEMPLLVNKSIDLLSKSLIDLNHLSKSLDADLISNHGLLHALEYELEKWSISPKIKVAMNVIGDAQYLKTSTELIIFRIIQESLSNIIKYAEATKIQISIIYKETMLQCTISDNGIGFNPEKVISNKKAGEKAGLINMKKRAEMVNGKFEIHSTLHSGTTILVHIPY